MGEPGPRPIDDRQATFDDGFGWMTDIGWADDIPGLGRSGDPKWMTSEFQYLK